MRFTAPADTTAAFLSTGPVSVVDGAIDAPDDLPAGDLRGLATAGFVPAAIVPAAPAAPVTPPSGSNLVTDKE